MSQCPYRLTGGRRCALQADHAGACVHPDDAAMLPNRWICAKCGYDGFRTGDVRSPVEVSIAYGCPVPRCGGALYRDDPLGSIERGLLPVDFDPFTEIGGV